MLKIGDEPTPKQLGNLYGQPQTSTPVAGSWKEILWGLPNVFKLRKRNRLNLGKL